MINNSYWIDFNNVIRVLNFLKEQNIKCTQKYMQTDVFGRRYQYIEVHFKNRLQADGVGRWLIANGKEA